MKIVLPPRWLTFNNNYYGKCNYAKLIMEEEALKRKERLKALRTKRSAGNQDNQVRSLATIVLKSYHTKAEVENKF